MDYSLDVDFDPLNLRYLCSLVDESAASYSAALLCSSNGENEIENRKR